MPFNNNRNSRDDKSKKPSRSTKSSSDFASKPPRSKSSTDSSNDDKKKLFGTDNKRPFSGGFKKDDGKPTRDGGKFAKPSEKRGEGSTDRKPYGKPDGDRFGKSSERRSEGTSERSTFSKPAGDRFGKAAEKRSEGAPERKAYSKPSGDRFGKPSERRSEGSSERPERKAYGKPDGDTFSKPTQRRPKTEGGKFEPRNTDNKFSRPKSDFGGPEKPSRYGKPETGKPYTKDFKPAAKRDYSSIDRKWTSEERIENKPTATRSKKASADDGLIRLNRYISNAGICSRRKADELIEAGVISVNGEAVSELGAKVDPMRDVIRYNGETLRREKMVYVLLNKPKDYITTTDDPHERRTVMQLVEKASKERIYPVGRLDRNTTGLLLMTNDGDLTDKLSHPKNNVVKIYNVELNRSLPQGDMNKIAYGLELEDGIIKPDEVSYVAGGSKREIGIQIHSGKNRIVRRIFEHLGYEVVKLDRVIYANLTKKDLPRGRWRYLEEKEIIQLKHLIKI